MHKQATRRIGKGILAVGILLAMLVIATGSASANGVCVGANYNFSCGMEVNESCTLNATMSCSSGHGLQVGANGTSKDNPLIIDGAGYAIDGSSPGTCGPPRSGIYNPGYDNVTIKNLEIKNFCWGIKLSDTTGNYVENNTIDNCKVHDNGNASTAGSRTNGIELYSASHCNITNSTVYNNTGYVETSCGTGGHGIRLYGADVEASWAGYHNVINNTIYNNTMAGIFSKMKSKYNNVSYNKIYENGKDVGGNTNYMGGGIRLECIYTNNWTVKYNTVTDNFGPGTFVRGNYNNITHNDVTNNKNASSMATGTGVGVGYGIFFHSVGDYNNITANRVCNNNGTDIRDRGTGNHGDNNICYLTQNWNDDGTTGCTYDCVHAYKYQVDNSPRANDPNEEFNTTEYANARVKDEVKVCNTTTTTGNYAAHRFNFTVREPASKIEKIVVIWDGKGWHDSATNGAKLRAYNFTASEYRELNSTTETTSTTEKRLTGEINSSLGVSNYIDINTNNVTVLVNQTSAHSRQGASHICTDLAKIVIYFKDP